MATILDHITITSCLDNCKWPLKGSLCFFLWIPNTVTIGILRKLISQIISLFCWEVSNNALRLKGQRFYNGLPVPLKCSSLLTLISCHLTALCPHLAGDPVPPQTWQVCSHIRVSAFAVLLAFWHAPPPYSHMTQSFIFLRVVFTQVHSSQKGFLWSLYLKTETRTTNPSPHSLLCSLLHFYHITCYIFY